MRTGEMSPKTPSFKDSSGSASYRIENQSPWKANLKGQMFRSRRLLVTDVVEDIFKYVLLEKTGDGYKVEKYGRLHASELSTQINNKIELHRAGMEWVNVNLDPGWYETVVISSSLDFFVRRFVLPELKKKELYRAASWEVDKLIPIPVADSYLILKKGDSSGEGRLVSVGAAPRHQVDPWGYLGESLKHVIPAATALAALGPRSESANAAYCYVYSDDENLQIGFYNSNGLQYSHPIQKSRGHLFNTGPDEFAQRRVVEELTGSIEVFYSYFPEIVISGIVLICQPAIYDSLSAAIGDRIEVKVMPYVPPKLQWSDGGDSGSIDIGILPLLGAIRAGREDFAFVPQSIKDGRRLALLRKMRRYIIIAGVILAVQLASFWGYELDRLRTKLGNFEAEKTAFANSEVYQRINEYKSGAEFLISLRRNFESNNDANSTLMKILSGATPDGVFLEGYHAFKSESATKVHIIGYYDGDLSRADVTIMHFMEALNSGAFEKLKLQRLGTRINGNRKIESFVLDGDWHYHG